MNRLEKYNRFDLVNKVYQRSTMDKIHCLKNDIITSPIVIDIDPITLCNLSCPHCISSSLLNQKSFSRDKLIELSNDFIELKIKAVIITGGGEPLLNKYISEFICKLFTNNIAVGLVTNGICIDNYLEMLANRDDLKAVLIDII